MMVLMVLLLYQMMMSEYSYNIFFKLLHKFSIKDNKVISAPIVNNGSASYVSQDYFSYFNNKIFI